MSLKDRLSAQIRQGGPLTIAQYMTACLHDPNDGYYATHPSIGADGDFITAPAVSQMFGELLGLWAVETWRGLGRPDPVLLVEVGPGDGSLIADALRAARLDPAFLAAMELWLVETSAPLAAAQRARLAAVSAPANWAAGVGQLPPGAPMILIANELLDCLPARQFVRAADGWAERMVALDAAGDLGFALSACVGGEAPGVDAPIGSVVEVCAAQTAFAAEIAARIVRWGGAALLIDYGRAAPGVGDTLQALRAHQKVHSLASPGEADLTVHADFPAVMAAARAEGANASLLSQGEFLRRLGIEARADALARARPNRAEVIARQLARLIDEDQMGELFKAACLWAPQSPPPPGYGAP
jgi:NADH dehydrogenase [ubiquinone] 1 alpha subcomplex assembly factor 7